MVDPAADAEAIEWEIRVADEVSRRGRPQNVLSHSLRIKVYTDHGGDTQSRFDIPFLKGIEIEGIEGRTIRPDGSIVPLKPGDIFERTMLKLSGVKLQAKSFTLPAVEPGCILDVRWREVHPGQIANYVRLPLQRNIPIQRLKLMVKPLTSPYFPFDMRCWTFQGQLAPFQKEILGFFSSYRTMVPAFEEEPYMPPENQIRGWALIYYSPETKLAPEAFWKELGKAVHKFNKDAMRPSRGLRKMAEEALRGAATPEQKLDRLMELCHTKVKNVWAPGSGLSDEEKLKLEPAKKPEGTLKRGQATGPDLYRLFAALAEAAGFESRLALLPDRSDMFFDRGFLDPFVLREMAVAVRIGNSWRFYDPGQSLVPSGMLRWQQEGQEALLCDAEDPIFVKTPLSTPEISVRRRQAELELAEDGTLSGHVTIELSGHPGIEHRYENAELSSSERETLLKDTIRQRLARAEISEVQFENLSETAQPFRVSYAIRIPGYASRTGKRLFFQPALFQKDGSPVFTSQKRLHQIYFPYTWSEEDHISIALPAGYTVDMAQAPEPFTVENLGRYEVRIQPSADGSKLAYQRKFHFSGMLFPKTSYAPLKKVFDLVHERDNQTVALKQSAEAAN